MEFVRGLCAERLYDVDMAYNRLSGFGATGRGLSTPLGLPRDDDIPLTRDDRL